MRRPAQGGARRAEARLQTESLAPRWLMLFLLAAGLHAEELSIRIAGQAQPDCWSIDSIVSAVTKGAASDRQKALALHRFGMAHFIHFNGPIEERSEYVNDPLKLIGVYGYSLCGNTHAAMAALYNAAGLKARTRSMPGHSVPEVWFENKWNYIDTDMFGYVYLPDRRIASVDELSADAGLFMKQSNPPDPYYPFDRKEDMASVFRNARAHRNFHPYANAHLMNLALRTGESATLYYRPQGRYLLTTFNPPDLGTVYKDYWVLGPVRRGSLAWCDRPPAAYGNGLIEYRPDIRSEAFLKENPKSSGTAAGQGRQQPELRAASPGQTASVVLEMSTPWVIVGLQNDPTDFDDDTDGAVVSGLFWRTEEKDENRILVSVDGGRTWKKVWENRFRGAVPFQVDLTRYVKGRYAYWLKFEWTDSEGTGRAGLEQPRVKTWVAVSPMGLPRLTAGKNTFALSTAAKRTWYHESRWDRAEPLEDQRLANLAVHDRFPYLRPPGATETGSLDFALDAPGTVEEVRLSVLARKLGGAKDTSVAFAVSEDSGRTWRELERFAPHPEHDMNQMWFNHAIRGRTLDGASTRLRITVLGAGLEKVIANSALRSAPRSPSMLRVTHDWKEGGQPRSATREFAPGAPRDYLIDAAPGLVNESLRIEALPAALAR